LLPYWDEGASGSPWLLYHTLWGKAPVWPLTHIRLRHTLRTRQFSGAFAHALLDAAAPSQYCGVVVLFGRKYMRELLAASLYGSKQGTSWPPVVPEE
jgi:hypothetical protein